MACRTSGHAATFDPVWTGVAHAGRVHGPDYVRHGTTTLFAALNVLEGTVIGSCKPRHRHQEPPRQRVVRGAPALPSALRPDQFILAQSRRTLVRGHHA